MKSSVFEYLDYRRYLHGLLELGGRGERKRLADALDCQMAFVSHVLSGAKDFNHEQVLKAARHFHLSESESEYLLELLSFNRAGTSDLREHYRSRLETRRAEQKQLKNRLREKQNLVTADQTEYYSSWIYGAVHMAATVPELQSVKSLSEHFQVHASVLHPILEFLSSRGLILLEGGQIKPGRVNLFLSKDSPLVNQHHTIWRIKTLHDLKANKPEDFHYSMCFSVSKTDWPILREKLLTAIDECLQVIRPSPAEKLGIICVDFQEA